MRIGGIPRASYEARGGGARGGCEVGEPLAASRIGGLAQPIVCRGRPLLREADKQLPSNPAPLAPENFLPRRASKTCHVVVSRLTEGASHVESRAAVRVRAG